MNNLIVKDWTIGADIECFLMEKDTQRIVSAEPYIPGTKHKPFNFDVSNKYFATSLDNVLAEYCIPPVKDKVNFVGNINRSLDYIRKIIPAALCIASLPSAILDRVFLNTDNAKTFGCEPDFNAWLRQENPRPIADNDQLRSSGMHIHVGHSTGEDFEVAEKMVKAMDLFLGVPATLIEPDNERRKLYGKAGAFRIKEYGFEYRVLSGFFASTDELKSWVFDNTIKAIDFVNEGGSDEIDSVGDIIQQSINTNNKVLASNLINQFQIQMV